MIKRWLSRSEWEPMLRALGCEPAPGIPKRGSGEFWSYPDKKHYPFFVPLEAEDMMDGWALRHILKELRGEKPPR